MTASRTRSPRNLPASSTSLRSTCALISSGAYFLPRTSNRAAPPSPFDDVEADSLRFIGDLIEPATDESLRRIDRALGVHDGLPPGQLPDQALTVLSEGHHRRCGSGALGVGDHYRFARPARPR